MKILIAAIGKSKASLEQQLYLDYIKRLKWKVEVRECDIKTADAVQRKEREGEWLLDACRGFDRKIALDESGKLLNSREFSGILQGWQGGGDSSFAFIIGGADGLSKPLLHHMDVLWSFGRVTWPHMLVRALLAEQLYRAQSILAGHPYHRDG